MPPSAHLWLDLNKKASSSHPCSLGIAIDLWSSNRCVMGDLRLMLFITTTDVERISALLDKM